MAKIQSKKVNKMRSIQAAQLKHELSSVLESVRNGDEFVVEFGRKHERVAVILPYGHYKQEQKREFGVLQGKGSFELAGNFEISDEELLSV